MADYSAANIIEMFKAIGETIEAQKGHLCELDGKIGDADHGVAMALGFGAVDTALAALDANAADPTTVFNTAAKSFLNAVGASTGPLYATAFMRAGAVAKGKPTLGDDEIAEVFQAMSKGIQDRGKAQVGEKTMVDAWQPAANAMAQSHANGIGLAASFTATLAAARQGAESTKDMVAAKGRSARLGERSLGHIDPGAASAVMVIEAMGRGLALGS